MDAWKDLSRAIISLYASLYILQFYNKFDSYVEVEIFSPFFFFDFISPIISLFDRWLNLINIVLGEKSFVESVM